MKKYIILSISLFVMGTCKPMAQPNGQQPNQPPQTIPVSLANNITLHVPSSYTSLIEKHSALLQSYRENEEVDADKQLLQLFLENLTYPQLLKVINLYQNTLHENFNKNMIADYNQEQLYSLLKALDYLEDEENTPKIFFYYLQEYQKQFLFLLKNCEVKIENTLQYFIKSNTSMLENALLVQFLCSLSKEQLEKISYGKSYNIIGSWENPVVRRGDHKSMFFGGSNGCYILEDTKSPRAIALPSLTFDFNQKFFITVPKINQKMLVIYNINEREISYNRKHETDNDIRHCLIDNENTIYIATDYEIVYSKNMKFKFLPLLNSKQKIKNVTFDAKKEHLIVATENAVQIYTVNDQDLKFKEYLLNDGDTGISSISCYNDIISWITEGKDNKKHLNILNFNREKNKIITTDCQHNCHALIDQEIQVFWNKGTTISSLSVIKAGTNINIISHNPNKEIKSVTVDQDARNLIIILQQKDYQEECQNQHQYIVCPLNIDDIRKLASTIKTNSLSIELISAYSQLKQEEEPTTREEEPTKERPNTIKNFAFTTESKSSWFSWPTIKKYSSYAALGVGAAVGLYAAYKYFKS